MSALAFAPVPGGRYLHELEEQCRALRPCLPERLVVCCDEPDRADPIPWSVPIRRDLFLRTPGAAVRGPGIREAIHHAVGRWAVDEVQVVAHSRCVHLEPPVGPGSAGAPGEPRSFERMWARLARSQAQLAEAREHVREAVRALRTDPVTRGIHARGLVHVVESGAVLVYDPVRDTFEARA